MARLAGALRPSANPPNLKRRPVAVVVRGVGLLRLMVFDPVGGQIFLLSCAVRLVQKPVLA